MTSSLWSLQDNKDTLEKIAYLWPESVASLISNYPNLRKDEIILVENIISRTPLKRAGNALTKVRLKIIEGYRNLERKPRRPIISKRPPEKKHPSKQGFYLDKSGKCLFPDKAEENPKEIIDVVSWCKNNTRNLKIKYWHDLENEIIPYQEGRLLVVRGKQGSGKTSAAMSILYELPTGDNSPLVIYVPCNYISAYNCNNVMQAIRKATARELLEYFGIIEGKYKDNKDYPNVLWLRAFTQDDINILSRCLLDYDTDLILQGIESILVKQNTQHEDNIISESISMYVSNLYGAIKTNKPFDSFGDWWMGIKIIVENMDLSGVRVVIDDIDIYSVRHIYQKTFIMRIDGMEVTCFLDSGRKDKHHKEMLSRILCNRDIIDISWTKDDLLILISGYLKAGHKQFEGLGAQYAEVIRGDLRNFQDVIGAKEEVIAECALKQQSCGAPQAVMRILRALYSKKDEEAVNIEETIAEMFDTSCADI